MNSIGQREHDHYICLRCDYAAAAAVDNNLYDKRFDTPYLCVLQSGPLDQTRNTLWSLNGRAGIELTVLLSWIEEF